MSETPKAATAEIHAQVKEIVFDLTKTRDEIAEAMYASTGVSIPWSVVVSDPDYRARLVEYRRRADAAMTVVGPEVERLRDEKWLLHESAQIATRQWLDTLDRFRGYADILDGIAEGLEGCYGEAAAHAPRALVRSMRRALDHPTEGAPDVR